MQKILVTGAAGAVGPRVVEYLLSAGYYVRTLTVNPPPSCLFPQGVEVCVGDVTQPSSVKPAMNGVDAVVHLAALLHIVNPGSVSLLENYRSINIGGTRTVLDAALSTGVQRLILASTISVYGPSRGQTLDESSPVCPISDYAQTKLAAERMVLGARGIDHRPMGVVLRLGAVYGPRMKGNYRRLVKFLASRLFVPVGKGDNRRSLVHEKDVARAVLLALQQPKAGGRVYNVTDGELHKLKDIINAICNALGRKPPSFSIPTAHMRLAAGIVEDTARLFGHACPISRSTIDKYNEDVAVNGQLIQTELGFRPEFDLHSGWQDTIREMFERGDL